MTHMSIARLAGLNMPGLQSAIASTRRLKKPSSGYRTPLFQSYDAKTIIDNWMKRIPKDSFVYDLEQAEYEKTGPYASKGWEDMEPVLDTYYRDSYPADLHREHGMGEVIQSVVDELIGFNRTQKIARTSVEEAVSNATRSTNLGLPLFTTDWNDDNLRNYVERAERAHDGDVKFYPFVVFKRVQPRGWPTAQEPYPARTRPVWGADHAETFSGLCYLKPTLDLMSRMPWFGHLLGDDALNSTLSKRLPQFKFKLSADLSQADASVGPTLQSAGFDLLNSIWRDANPGYLEGVMAYYATGELLIPGRVRTGTHGLPSGVSFTNLLETVVFRAVFNHIIRQMSNDFEIYGNGDDLLILSNDELSLEEIERQAGSYGLAFNKTKSDYSEDQADYLQRHYYEANGYNGVMSTVRMLNRILFAERGVDVKRTGMSVQDYWTLNTIMKLENCKRHPMFEEFVEFVRSGDKFGLSIANILDANLGSARGYSVQADTVGTLADFETVRFLSRM